MNPNRTGPTRKPIFVVAATNETPSAVFMPSTFEASRYTSGTITEKPSPITKKPGIVNIGFRIKASEKPVIAIRLDQVINCHEPSFLLNESPVKRPIIIANENAE